MTDQPDVIQVLNRLGLSGYFNMGNELLEFQVKGKVSVDRIKQVVKAYGYRFHKDEGDIIYFKKHNIEEHRTSAVRN
tara:strand:+ start:162 stop:392 length:231 start_codon:yes stop_codon:yes gene_type:complete